MKNFQLLTTALAVFAVVSGAMAMKTSQIQLYKPATICNGPCVVPAGFVNGLPVMTDLCARLGSPGACGVVQYDAEP